MFIMLARIIQSLINLYSILIVVYVLMSWIPRGASRFVEDVRAVLASVCEPYLGLFRRFIPPLGMVDWSPIVAILALEVLTWLVVAILV